MQYKLDRKIIIRPAQPKDKNIIIYIQVQALQFLANQDYNQQQLQALLKSKSTPRKSDELIFMAEIEGRAVGFASLLHPLNNTIGAVFVLPNFARQGIGTQLLKRLEAEAKAKHIPILWVCASLTGHGFYQANGYQTIRKNFLPLYSTYVPCYQMKKRLLPITSNEIWQEISQLLILLTIITLIMVVI